MVGFMKKIKKPLLFVLCILPIALVAGAFSGIYQLNTFSDEIIAQVVAEIGSVEILVVVTAMQTVGYALFCGFFGYIMADKMGLIKPFKISKKPLVITLVVSVIGGIVFSLDHWVFGSFIDGIQTANEASLTLSGVMVSILYGGIIEEVMMRLFFMTLIAFIIWKLFCRKYSKDNIPVAVFVISNIIAALAFAALHLPATVAIFGELTPIIIFRCFLLNGGFAIIFGELYRRYGIVYAMMSHALFHIVSKLIWFIFI